MKNFILFGVIFCAGLSSCKLARTFDKTQYVNNIPSLHKEDTIVIFKPIYLKVDFNNWHSWHKIRIDSGYYANLEQPQLINEEYDRKVNTYLDDKLYEKCMGDYKKIFANRINYYFPQKYASPNENLKKALDDLKDSMKEKNLQN